LSAGNDNNPDKNMSTKSSECWANEAHARGVRVEITADESLLLPHDEFVFAKLKRYRAASVL
jgi:hypothetical protein